MVCRATGANENYWPLGNVSDDGSCYAKANSTISIHSGSDPLGFLIHSGSGPLGHLKKSELTNQSEQAVKKTLNKIDAKVHPCGTPS